MSNEELEDGDSELKKMIRTLTGAVPKLSQEEIVAVGYLQGAIAVLKTVNETLHSNYYGVLDQFARMAKQQPTEAQLARVQSDIQTLTDRVDAWARIRDYSGTTVRDIPGDVK